MRKNQVQCAKSCTKNQPNMMSVYALKAAQNKTLIMIKKMYKKCQCLI